MVGLLDALDIEKAVFCGHDWGGFVVWAMPILHPERTAGVIGVNTPYLPRGAEPPTAVMRRMVGGQDEKMYILWFQEFGVADPMLAANTRAVFQKLMRGGVEPAAALAAFSTQEASEGGAGPDPPDVPLCRSGVEGFVDQGPETRDQDGPECRQMEVNNDGRHLRQGAHQSPLAQVQHPADRERHRHQPGGS